MADKLWIGILAISALTFLAIGASLLRAKETKASCFKKAKATIVARGRGGYECISPVVQFMDGTREVTAGLVYEISDKPEYKRGAKLDVLYCPKRVLGIPIQSVILDDGDISLQRIRRFYLFSGTLFFIIGLGFVVVTIAMCKAWL